MVFSNLFFLYFFLPLNLICYFLAKSIHVRNGILIVFSLFFYAWGEPRYVPLLVGMVLINWIFGLMIEKYRGQKLAKAGLIGLGKALAKEEGPSGITVNVIAPGVIDTDMMAGFTAEDRAALAEETPVERLGTADEIARTMVFLADEASGYITGQVLGVNGGLVI